MAKEATIEMEGTVQEVLPNTQFRVRLTNGADVLAYAGGKMRQRRIRIIAGDRVSLEMSPYDVTRGRINYRHLDSPPPGGGVKRRTDAAWRSPAGIFAVSQDDDDARPTAEVENLGALLDGERQRCAPNRHQTLHRSHYAGGGVRHRWNIELDVVALIEEPRVTRGTIGNEPHASNTSHAWQDLG